MYTCYCSKCLGKDYTTSKTLRKHLKSDEELLKRSDIADSLRERLQNCITNTKKSLHSSPEEVATVSTQLGMLPFLLMRSNNINRAPKMLPNLNHFTV